MRREVGAYEAKTKLPQLLREVAGGDEITITVRGRPIAELVPPRRQAPSAEDAVEAMLGFDAVKGVEDALIESWIEDGRR